MNLESYYIEYFGHTPTNREIQEEIERLGISLAAFNELVKTNV